MCNYFSCIVTPNIIQPSKDTTLKMIEQQGFRVWYSLKTSSHEDIIEELKQANPNMQDVDAYNRNFVRFETTPKNSSQVTRNPEDWNQHTDEDSVSRLPEFYSLNKQKIERLVWAAWAESVAVQLVISEEERRGQDIQAFLYGKARFEAFGNCSIEAFGNCSIEAFGNCSIRASGNCSIRASGNCSIEAFGNCSIRASDNCSIRASDNCSIRASDNCSIRASDNCSIRASDNCSIRASDNCSIRASDNCSIRASDNCRTISYSTGVKVTFNSETSTLLFNGQIFFAKTAKVHRLGKTGVFDASKIKLE